MYQKIVDLYQYYGFASSEDAQCSLTCLGFLTSPEVSTGRRKPAILIIPGGGYSHVSAREAEPVAIHFMTRGYAAFILRYSCAPCTFPVQLREAAMAMRYIREHAEEYEVNPAMVAATGFSAGGHLCGLLGTMYDTEEVADIGPAELLRPDALGLCYPVAVQWGPTHEGTFENISGGDPNLRQRLSLDGLVRPDMPPVFLWHTRSDEAVPCRNSLILAASLDEVGVDFSAHIYRYGKHGLSTADAMVYPVEKVPETSWDVSEWINAEMRFFKEIGFEIIDSEE